MNPFTQGEGSSGPSVRPEKRRRGRPRKDPRLKDKEAAHVAAPIFEGMTKTLPRESDSPNGAESVVGQPVAGFVEASFDAGYLLTVRIGNSSTNLRGVVFKPGHFVPVTAENDVAPHLQMIRRNDIHSQAENCSWSRRRPKLAIRTAGQKSKYSSPKPASSVPPVGIRGNLIPVVLQPVDLPSRLSSSRQMPSDASRNAHLLTFGDKDVQMAEPLSIVPPDHAIPVNQISVGSQLHSNHQVPQDNVQNSDKPFNEGTSGFGQGEKVESMESTDADNLASSGSSDTETVDGKEDTKSSAEEEDSGLIPKQEIGNMKEMFSTEPLQTASAMNFSTASLQPSPVGIPLFSYGTGRMTELLQAVQENKKGKTVQMPEQQLPSASNVTGAPSTDKNN